MAAARLFVAGRAGDRDGNRVIAVPAEAAPLSATDFYQVLETSDVPGGVVNIVTGKQAGLAKTLAEHADVDALWSFGTAEVAAMIERASVSNLKRVFTDHGRGVDWLDRRNGEGRHFLRQAVQVKKSGFRTGNKLRPYGFQVPCFPDEHVPGEMQPAFDAIPAQCQNPDLRPSPLPLSLGRGVNWSPSCPTALPFSHFRCRSRLHGSPSAGHGRDASRRGLSHGAGGKGSNQAVAAGKAGGKVSFITKVGRDPFGDIGVKTWAAVGVDTSSVIVTDDHPTGAAFIFVSTQTGNNAIIVESGAAGTISIADVESRADVIRNAKVFVTQFEQPLDAASGRWRSPVRPV